MKIEFIHPADMIIMTINRIYGFGMTTTTGGNLSICDSNGDVWITPSGIDKGTLTRDDIIKVTPDGTVSGKHKPSMELPFHSLIYKQRTDVKAIIHAHPPGLVAFSMIRKLPDTNLFPVAYEECGTVDMAEYALPGSRLLGEKVAMVFEKGVNTVILENHGAVTVGENMVKAFGRFETLDYCARIEINANIIGKPLSLNSKTFEYKSEDMGIGEIVPEIQGSILKRMVKELCSLIKRSYTQKLFISTSGTFSQRLDEDSFVITPNEYDRYTVCEDEIVLVRAGLFEMGKTPDKTFLLHKLIYEKHPHINSVIIATPPATMAFAVTKEAFETKTIPESYIVLRNVQRIPFETDNNEIVEQISKHSPVAIIENKFIIATGSNPINAFDRLEVLEYSAQSLLSARSLKDNIVAIDDKSIAEIDEAFKI